LLRLVEQRLRQSGDPRLLSLLDGKPLSVSGVSKDPDARWGQGAGGKAKGYKLHTLWSGRPLPEAWRRKGSRNPGSPSGGTLVAARRPQLCSDARSHGEGLAYLSATSTSLCRAGMKTPETVRLRTRSSGNLIIPLTAAAD
jgi:hypothetical protein